MAQGVKPNLPKIKCELCGTLFQKKTRHHRFCSRKCEQRNVAIINPVSKRKNYKKWLKNKLITEPDFYKKRYYERKEQNYEKFREQRNRWAKTNYQRLRLKALEYYGGKCACCGEKQNEFLGIDHVGGGGTKHREKLKVHIYRYLSRNNYPEGFRILCHNCNLSLGFYGYCPHKKI